MKMSIWEKEMISNNIHDDKKNSIIYKIKLFIIFIYCYQLIYNIKLI